MILSPASDGILWEDDDGRMASVKESESGEPRRQSVKIELSIEVGRHAVTDLPDHDPIDMVVGLTLDSGLNHSASKTK